MFAFFSSSCSYLKNVKLLSQGEIKRQNYVQQLPFEWRKGLIVLKARLNADTAEREFIFDTGAFNSKIEFDLAEALKLKVVTTKENSTAQGISKEIEVVRIDSIQLGETYIYNLGAGKLKYSPKSASRCIAADGIIGANLIKLAHWKIDYANQILYFSDAPFQLIGDFYSLPFERPLLSGTPKIELAIEGKEIENILFDVGYNGGLVLPLKFEKYFQNSKSTIYLDHSTSGIYGTNKDSLLVKKLSVNVGGCIEEIPVEFSTLNKALLGNDYLKHFLVFLDYDKKVISLQKQSEADISFPSNIMVGIENDSTWVVNRSAYKVPLKLGEKLKSINGKKPKDLFTSYCDYINRIHILFENDSLYIQKMDNTFISIATQ